MPQLRDDKRSGRSNTEMRSSLRCNQKAVTLIELLCVIVVIGILAALILGPASRALKLARADQWGDEASASVEAITKQLNQRFAGAESFGQVTLEALEKNHYLSPHLIDFLKDSRVTFFPFSSADKDEMIVIRVIINKGFLTDPGFLTETKGRIANRRD